MLFVFVGFFFLIIFFFCVCVLYCTKISVPNIHEVGQFFSQKYLSKNSYFDQINVLLDL